MPRTGWANFLNPLFYTQDTKAGVMYQIGQGLYPSYYCGVFVIFLAGIGFIKSSSSTARTLGGLSLLLMNPI